MSFTWDIREFRDFQHHTLLTKKTLSEKTSLWYTFQFTLEEKQIKMAIYSFTQIRVWFLHDVYGATGPPGKIYAVCTISRE